MVVTEIFNINISMNPAECYDLWSVLDQVDDANDIEIPIAVRNLTTNLRAKFMEDKITGEKKC